MSALAPLVVVQLVLVGLIVLLLVRSRGRTGFLDEVARRLGGTRTGTTIRFSHGGVPHRCVAFLGGRHQRSWIEMRRWSRAPARFAIAPAGSEWRTRPLPGERVGTGDPELDAQTRVASPRPLEATAFLAESPRRAAIRALLGLDVARVDQDDDELRVRWTPFRPGPDLLQRMTAALEPIGRLAGAVPDAPAIAAAEGAERRRRRVRAACLAAVAGGFVAAGAARGAYPALDDGEVLRATLWYSVPLAVVLALEVRRRAGAAADGSATPLALGTLIVVPVVVSALALVVNGAADDGPPTVHDARILRAYATGGRSSSYHVVVASWRGRAEERITVTSVLYRRLGPSTPRLRIVTKPGRLGYEWVSSCGLPDGHV